MPTAYKNPLEAETGLSKAFNPQTPEQAAAIKRAAALVPGSTVATPTSLFNPGTPSPVSNVDPVIGNSTVRRYVGNNTESPLEREKREFSESLPTALPDENKIREDMRNAVTAQIDTIDNLYETIIADAKVSGQNALGRTRAAAARGGRLGSSFGDAELDTTTKQNDAVIKAREAERALAIQNVLAKVDERAEAKIKAQTEQAYQNRETRIKYLEGVADETRSDLVTFFQSGGKVESLAGEELSKILDQTGMTEEQIKQLGIINAPKETVVTSGTQGNIYYKILEDPITKVRRTEKITLPFEVPVDWGEKEVDGGIFFYDTKHPQTNYVYTVAPKTDTVKDGAFKTTEKELADGRKLLDNSRGTDNYANTEIYNTMFKNWIDGGGTKEGFLKRFPAKDYVNPADASLDSRLKSGGGSTAREI